MAEIKSVDMNGGQIQLKLSVSQEEYKILRYHTSDILVLPGGRDTMKYLLTTGKLGNSNRIMLPKKIMEAFEISTLDKKVPMSVFIIDDNAYLLIRIKKSEFGIPK
ncbi:MAG: hypothetical protein V1813_00575, partial [Candidatus Aenigmatarchaeota archaeon]